MCSPVATFDPYQTHTALRDRPSKMFKIQIECLLYFCRAKSVSILKDINEELKMVKVESQEVFEEQNGIVFVAKQEEEPSDYYPSIIKLS